MSASNLLKSLPLYGEPWTPGDIVNMARAEQVDAVVRVLNALPAMAELAAAAEEIGPNPTYVGSRIQQALGDLEKELQ